MKPLYIFDLDGTLALIDHRLHFIRGAKSERSYEKFYAACANDKPNTPVIDLFDRILTFADVYIFTGRSAEVRQETRHWLDKNTRMRENEMNRTLLTMRPIDNRTPDHELKRQWYRQLPAEDKARLAGVFEDRTRVVDMWRALGVQCYQVSSGDF